MKYKHVYNIYLPILHCDVHKSKPRRDNTTLRRAQVLNLGGIILHCDVHKSKPRRDNRKCNTYPYTKRTYDMHTLKPSSQKLQLPLAMRRTEQKCLNLSNGHNTCQKLSTVRFWTGQWPQYTLVFLNCIAAFRNLNAWANLTNSDAFLLFCTVHHKEQLRLLCNQAALIHPLT